MATETKHVVDRIKDLTLCGICADTLTDSRVLPCLHTFCLECLRLAGAELRPYQSMPCPICRSEFRVPRQGFSELQKNFLMENLLEIGSLPSPSVEIRDSEGPGDLGGGLQRPCDVCSEAGTSDVTTDTAPVESEVDLSAGTQQVVAAVVYCVDCRQSLCRLCRNHHRRVPATRQHRFSDDPEIAENFRKLASENVGAAMTWINEANRKRERVAGTRTKYLDEVLRAESDVIRVRDDAKRVIDSRADLLLGELGLAKQKHLEEFRNDLDRLDCHLAIVESFMNRCLHAKDAVADDVICRIGDDLNATADDLRSIHRTHLDEQVTDAHVTVESKDFDEFLERKEQRQNTEEVKKNESETVDESLDLSFSSESLKKRLRMHSVAIIVIITSIVLAIFLNNYIPKVRLVSLQLAKRLHESHSVMGVTSADDHIFVISRSTRSIFVYEGREPFDLVKEIPVPRVKSPWDLVASPSSNNLFISDQENSCVWSLSLEEVASERWFSGTSYEHSLTLWLTGITEPYTLSTSRDGGVLLLRGGASPRLEKYLPSAALEQSVDLPADAEDPRHLLETSAGSYVVSYGWSGTRHQGIVELDINGRVIRSQDPLYEWQRLKNPYHMAIDADDRVFVADFYNNRLLLLVANGNGWDMRTILDEAGSGVVKPHRLALSGGGGGGRLILVHDDGQTVDVYNVTQSL